MPSVRTPIIYGALLVNPNIVGGDVEVDALTVNGDLTQNGGTFNSIIPNGKTFGVNCSGNGSVSIVTATGPVSVTTNGAGADISLNTAVADIALTATAGNIDANAVAGTSTVHGDAGVDITGGPNGEITLTPDVAQQTTLAGTVQHTGAELGLFGHAVTTQAANGTFADGTTLQDTVLVPLGISAAP